MLPLNPLADRTLILILPVMQRSWRETRAIVYRLVYPTIRMTHTILGLNLGRPTAAELSRPQIPQQMAHAQTEAQQL